ncbi:Uncharacterised protein [Mycobacteroides abscessus subsp. abscessus]|nr:Uncharacterised protein [Mycobacteroides abscessus subsp. abscessus]SKS04841.1 Uncharacterised protein [Mycobacteroides abscessus subsp. abscessus]
MSASFLNAAAIASVIAVPARTAAVAKLGMPYGRV